MTLHSIRFPGESPAYRESRDQLLQAEIDLRRSIEQVAALRRTLPPGGQIPEDYAFDEGPTNLDDFGPTRQTHLSELFGPGKDSLIVYSFMYGPEMQAACVMCTSFIDALNASAVHLTQRVNLAVVAKSPIERIRQFARERDWRNLHLLSSSPNSYNRDYHGENAEGGQLPTLNVFTRRESGIHHFFSTELVFLASESRQNQRHLDIAWPLWNLFDFTPEGRGDNWFPKLNYR
jgi:predicted dithiol-disulfide oxidoreductase (DUF899 family)